MDTVVTMLEPTYYDRVLELMGELKERCGVTGGFMTPLPHFSWHGAARYDLPRLEERLAAIAATARPFEVRTAGLGLFTGERPVLFIALTVTQELLAFHESLWNQTIDLAEEPSPYYTPGRWVPHITVAMHDLTPANIGCVMERIAFQPVDWRLRVDHVGLIHQPPGTVGRPGRQFRFGG